MEAKNVGALLLIILGASLLAKNLNISPGIIWPLALIILGCIALYQASTPKQTKENNSQEIIWEVNQNSSILGKIIAIPVFLIGIFFFFITIGLAGPFILLFLLFIPFILFLKLGWAFIRVMFHVLLAATPLVLIIWIISFLFI